ncbi:NAD(P)-binding protein [Testicularia cyperi]|uniref:NAD(P)-binding protein n=1 Tax=Testicularia cyperi TaxID=1882483 RepID=A0A317XYT8_9BASI|nr:NAD(P)-binding protein [Testicularia cyperi]
MAASCIRTGAVSFGSRALAVRSSLTSRTIVARSTLPPTTAPLSSLRAFSSSIRTLQREDDAKKAQLNQAPFARTDDDVVVPYPKDSSRHPRDDVGHNTTGGRVGRHTQRTLASFSMEGKVCVITGAARGIGNLIARTFVESGANHIAILDLNEEECQHAAKEVDEWFTKHGGVKPDELDIQGYGCDIANEESVQQTFDRIHQRFGRIDVVVNSAGIVENYPATEYPTPKMKKLFDININGSMYVAREAAKRMMADNIRGSIVLIASMSGSITNFPQAQAPYNASKAAVKHLATCLAVEWAKVGIRVNSLSPGYMLTSLSRAVLENSPNGKELRATWENMTPMGRLGDPEDLKGAIVYLASGASAYTTGADLIVDGGYTCV